MFAFISTSLRSQKRKADHKTIEESAREARRERAQAMRMDSSSLENLVLQVSIGVILEDHRQH